MLTNFSDTQGAHCGSHSGSHCGSHCGSHKDRHHRLRPECKLIIDCLTWCIPRPIKESCLIPRTQINRFIDDFMNDCN